MKMLLRCPKNKPYVERSPLNMCPDLYGAFDEQYEFEDLNGKIVAECDIEVEEIKYKHIKERDKFGILHNESWYEYKKLNVTNYECDFASRCGFGTSDKLFDYLSDYLVDKSGYAIHIKNLHIFDNPKELNEFRKGKWIERKEGPVYWVEEEIKKAPSNMIYVVDKKGNDCILLTVMHEPLCEILNGHQTIIIKKNVLKEMKR